MVYWWNNLLCNKILDKFQVIFFFFTSQASLLWGSFLLGFTVNGMMGGYGAVIAENYPSEARSTAENIIFGTGRGLSGFGPAIIGYLKFDRSNESCICYLSNSTYFYVVHCSRNKRYRNRLIKKGYAFA